MGGFDVPAVADAVRAAGEARLTAAGGITTAAEIAERDRIGADAQVGMALYTGRLPLGEAVTAPLSKALDGDVWPTVVCDEWGHALGLVWSTRESLARAITERKGIYWSRSRQAVWEKGATSGNTQELVRVDLDCDRDALRFTVRLRGAGFCHLERRACWPSGVDLDDLVRTLTERVTRPEPGSGTVKVHRQHALPAAKPPGEDEELERRSDRRRGGAARVCPAVRRPPAGSTALSRSRGARPGPGAIADTRACAPRASRRADPAVCRSPAGRPMSGDGPSARGSRRA